MRRCSKLVCLCLFLYLNMNKGNLKSVFQCDQIETQEHIFENCEPILRRLNLNHIEQIKSVNELRSDLIRVGDYLIVPLAQQTEGYYALSEKQREKSRLNAQKNSEKVIYKVVSGDSLWKIAVQFDTTVNSLVRWNQLIPAAPLSIGKKLVIWLENKNKTELAKIANTGIDISRKIFYTVRSGDNLSVIASKYNVKVIDIRLWNNLDKDHILQPGEKLTITINVVNSNLS